MSLYDSKNPTAQLMPQKDFMGLNGEKPKPFAVDQSTNNKSINHVTMHWCNFCYIFIGIVFYCSSIVANKNILVWKKHMSYVEHF